MRVHELIECLKDYDPDAWVHMHLLDIHTAKGDQAVTDHVRSCYIDSKGRVILLR